ncbi:YiiX/YebB-like N1pC/P60 family cysteine hydrolase [Porphyromonas pogonae]|uniref:YiiX/YebB-like N1pC/P60 family cysteine hydrolase n=1 Tax=Porphyromonas pogonae TaxID=867595 RepID=UPI002E786CF6|nr:YiiX/YebB-like N1pC/P60 family cysteine hydrolase [Porphyromonas pogonae]
MLFLFGCKSEQKTSFGPNPLSLVPDSLALQDADLICRCGNTWYSSYFRKVISKQKLFSHIGILTRDSIDGELHVYHMEEDESLHHHGMVKESLADFLSHSSQFGIYRVMMNEELRHKVVEMSNELLLRRLSFDSSFSDNSEQSLYCTEYVAFIFNSLNIDRIYPTLKLPGRTLYSLDDIIYQTHASCLMISPKY